MNVASRLNLIKGDIPGNVRLVAVSKFHPASLIQEAYDTGHRLFGESRVQELLPKYESLPKDIEWHFIGHLQVNKVKYLAPFIDTIESVDSLKLLKEINKEAVKYNRKVKVYLQVHIAEEEHKFGFSFEEVESLFKERPEETFPNIEIDGLMGMATFTDDEAQIRKEFAGLASFFRSSGLKNLSMGMSDDYPIAIEEGSTVVRIGSKIFGNREYHG